LHIFDIESTLKYWKQHCSIDSEKKRDSTVWFSIDYLLNVNINPWIKESINFYKGKQWDWVTFKHLYQYYLPSKAQDNREWEWNAKSNLTPCDILLYL